MLEVLRYKRYRSMPWRNGLGTTLEIAREPAQGEHFAWRLSLAGLDRDSSFSAYPGYRRALVLVDGSVLRLRFQGHGSALLGATKRGTRFEGAWRTSCALPDGPCTDLSLIVRAGSSAHGKCILREPAVLEIDRERQLDAPAGVHVALFVLEGSVGVSATNGARQRRLHVHDTLLLRPGPRRILTLRRIGQPVAKLALLRWRAGAAARHQQPVSGASLRI